MECFYHHKAVNLFLAIAKEGHEHAIFLGASEAGLHNITHGHKASEASESLDRLRELRKSDKIHALQGIATIRGLCDKVEEIFNDIQSE
ncbi:hypothetical protein CEE36_08725 [candidate division TA06 bacterium B3_TA06]|uniref:Uncharacterized protein n=1 Tax=candidate division TA06 bacterium B3_TA06 TaxID=2012487 RepID=A0A532V144_UNCT6|nr:MAG: hypothetical protein CEE36_08725 [candidate division TA06 bacterium B3_TA06]